MTHSINLDSFRVSPGIKNVYAIGLTDKNVTIRSQQVRAIALASMMTSQAGNEKKEVAIIGGGIAGLTFAAQLIKDGWKDIIIFERLPELLTVQNGCDTRWIHPNLIDWPHGQSLDKDADDAKLPTLSWKASTASNVTYQIEEGWRKIIEAGKQKLEALKDGEEPPKAEKPKSGGKPARSITTLLGVTFLKVHFNPRPGKFIGVEWIRDTKITHKKIRGDLDLPSGVKTFKHLVFATGFGIEPDSHDSYWRNESLGQMRIDGVQQRYMVSGLGDGAIIDLLRLTVRNFRPDRAMNELQLKHLAEALKNFNTTDKTKKLTETLEGYLVSRKRKRSQKSSSNLDEISDVGLKVKVEIRNDLMNLVKYFEERLRSDTYVLLHHRSNSGFVNAFEKSPASLLNKVFLFCLYKLGAFQYLEGAESGKEMDFARKYSIPAENIIRRHGVDRASLVRSLINAPPGPNFPAFDVFPNPQPVHQCLAAIAHLHKD